MIKKLYNVYFLFLFHFIYNLIYTSLIISLYFVWIVYTTTYKMLFFTIYKDVIIIIICLYYYNKDLKLNWDHVSFIYIFFYVVPFICLLIYFCYKKLCVPYRYVQTLVQTVVYGLFLTSLYENPYGVIIWWTYHK